MLIMKMETAKVSFVARGCGILWKSSLMHRTIKSQQVIFKYPLVNPVAGIFTEVFLTLEISVKMCRKNVMDMHTSCR